MEDDPNEPWYAGVQPLRPPPVPPLTEWERAARLRLRLLGLAVAAGSWLAVVAAGSLARGGGSVTVPAAIVAASGLFACIALNLVLLGLAVRAKRQFGDVWLLASFNFGFAVFVLIMLARALYFPVE